MSTARHKSHTSPFKFFGISALVLTGGITILLLVYLNLHWLPAYLIAINAVTFLTYAYDKFAARKQYRRTPENTLHLLAFLGGSPAALAAQQMFRHKTQKRSFQLMYWGIVVCQIAAITYWIMS